MIQHQFYRERLEATWRFYFHGCLGSAGNRRVKAEGNQWVQAASPTRVRPIEPCFPSKTFKQIGEAADGFRAARNRMRRAQTE